MSAQISLPADPSNAFSVAKSASDVDALGQELDMVEKEFDNVRWIDGLKAGHPRFNDICSRYVQARHAYFGAIRARLLNHIDEAERGERPVSLTQWYNSHLAHQLAKQRLEAMDAQGPNHFSAREHADASAVEEYAEAIEAIFYARYRERKRLNRVLKRARTSGSLARAVASPTGYRRTGSYVRDPNGVRIPVVEKD